MSDCKAESNSLQTYYALVARWPRTASVFHCSFLTSVDLGFLRVTNADGNTGDEHGLPCLVGDILKIGFRAMSCWELRIYAILMSPAVWHETSMGMSTRSLEM